MNNLLNLAQTDIIVGEIEHPVSFQILVKNSLEKAKGDEKI